MSDRAPRTCSQCGEEGHDIRTCEAPFSMSSPRSGGGECDEDCLYGGDLLPRVQQVLSDPSTKVGRVMVDGKTPVPTSLKSRA